MTDPTITESARLMSVVLAPVFLISGVGVMLSSMITRYGRVIDRVRVVLKECAQNTTGSTGLQAKDPLIKELRSLYKRARLLRSTIIFASASIFCVSSTIFLLFASLMFEIHVPWLAESLFVLSLLLLIIAVGLFIEDFALSLRILKHEVNSRLQNEVLSDSKIIS